MVDGKKVKIASADKGTQVKRAELVSWLLSTESFKKWKHGE